MSAVSPEHLRHLAERLREELSPRGLEMFQRLVIDEASVEAVRATTEMTPDAVYALRSRLGKLARRLLRDISASEPNIATEPASEIGA